MGWAHFASRYCKFSFCFELFFLTNSFTISIFLGNLSSSRVEAGHSYIKRFIHTSTGDLFTVFQHLSSAIDNQLDNIHQSLGSDSINKLLYMPHSFSKIKGQISVFAIKKAKEQFDLMKQDHHGMPCSHTFTKSLGIPCSHRIEDILRKSDFLLPSDFHIHWSLKYNPECKVNFLSFSYSCWHHTDLSFILAI